MSNKYHPIEVNGFWNDSREPFFGMWVCAGSWDGVEDAEDEKIFFYCDGEPVIGNHGDFTITEIVED